MDATAPFCACFVMISDDFFRYASTGSRNGGKYKYYLELYEKSVIAEKGKI